MESFHQIVSGYLMALSEQQLVDCDPKSSGCNGGLEIWAWAYAKNKPIALGSQYPYTGKDGRCYDSSVTGRVRVMATYSIQNTVAQHKAAISQQPIALGINASGKPFQYYRSGILEDPYNTCGTQIDHAVTGVGYGTENGKDYLIVRNSWGKGWGESGYIRIAIPKDGPGVCGILDDSGYAATN